MKTAKRYFKNRELSEKEILLYQAVNGLLERGESLSELRVADIAKEAGIGKGTVYEYVASKEELLANSFLYQVWKMCIRDRHWSWVTKSSSSSIRLTVLMRGWTKLRMRCWSFSWI